MQHTLTEEIVEILQKKTNNSDSHFFRLQVAYFYGLLAGNMRVSVKFQNNFPINTYVMNLAPSGYGKDTSLNILEKDIMGKFINRFLKTTFTYSATQNIEKMTLEEADMSGIKPDSKAYIELYNSYAEDFINCGSFLFSYDSGSTPAVKQIRQKLIYAGAGALNLQINEISSNFVSQQELLNLFIELYDAGIVKERATKHSKDFKRVNFLQGQTPANLIMYGSATKLLDGGKNEQLLAQFAEMGYGRRLLVGFADKFIPLHNDTSAEVLLASMLDDSSFERLEELSLYFESLADPENLNKVLPMSKEAQLAIVQYKLDCTNISEADNTIQETLRIELLNRYSKALKQAGAFAFVDKSDEVTLDHVKMAITLVEESAKHLNKLLKPPRPYMKLAQYLASTPSKLTLADLDSELQYFTGSKAYKDELISLAIAYGIKENIVIKREFVGDILMLSGETLDETKPDKLLLTVSKQLAEGYEPNQIDLESYLVLGETTGLHYCNHRFEDDHRCEDNVIDGFNCIILDVDEGFPIEAAKSLLSEYSFIIYTTKSHTEECNRYRIILPCSHNLYLSEEEYQQCMTNIYSILPFDVDESCKYRSKKWLSNAGECYYNLEGKFFNMIPFIPKTKRNEEFVKTMISISELDSLEKWYVIHGSSTRNNTLHKYSMVLKDLGLTKEEVESKLHMLNSKFPDPLPEDELNKTVLSSLKKFF